MAAGGTLARYRSALAYPDLRRMLTAFTITELGSWAYIVVLGVYIYDQTGSASAIALLAAIRWAASLIASPYAGVIADRYERRSVLVVCTLTSSLLLVATTIVVATEAPIWVLILTSTLTTLSFVPDRPAASALIPEIVDENDLVTANVLINVLENLVIVIGPLIGGALMFSGNDAAAIAVNAGCYALAALLYRSLTTRSRGDAGEEAGIFRQWTAGIGELARRPTAVALAACTVLSAGLYAPEMVIFAEMTTHLGVDQASYSSFFAASAVGGVLVVLVADRMASSSRLALLVVGCLFLQGAPYIVISQVTHYWLVLALLAISGAGLVMVDVIALTALQRTMPNGVMGRTMATVTAAAMMLAIVTVLGTGWALDAVGLTATLLFAGIAFPAASLLMLPLLLRGERDTAARTATIRGLADFIERLDLFDGLNRSGIETLALAAERISCPAGHVLIRQGEAADALWLVEEGSLDIDIAGQELAPPPVTAPGWVGEIGLLHNQPRSATVTASTPVTVLRIPGDRFLEAIESSSASRSLINLATERANRSRPGATAPAPLVPALEPVG
jgi:MFS family permease